jgi:hypothetical protein
MLRANDGWVAFLVTCNPEANSHHGRSLVCMQMCALVQGRRVVFRQYYRSMAEVLETMLVMVLLHRTEEMGNVL